MHCQLQRAKEEQEITTIYIKEGTQLPERVPFDHYASPFDFVEKGLDVVERLLYHPRCPDFVSSAFKPADPIHWFPNILDPGAGDGRWGTAAKERWSEAEIAGAEIRPELKPEAYSYWHCGDFFTLQLSGFDLVVGNPPYRNIEAWVRHSFDLLVPGGILCFLTHLSFLEGKGRGEGLFKEHPPFLVAVCKERPKFTGPGNPKAASFVAWVKGYEGPTELIWV